MPALSFQREFVDALLRGDKQQTTRPQTDRFKAGSICHIYNEQRRRISDKPLYRLTAEGRRRRDNAHGWDWAHFLGKVGITEVYVFKPWMHRGHGRHIYFEMWARADGFKNFHAADKWFTERYGDDWMQQTWTVIRWDGWQERYFAAGEV
jgi:hypothetical protein